MYNLVYTRISREKFKNRNPLEIYFIYFLWGRVGQHKKYNNN